MKTWEIKVLYLGKITAPLSMFWPFGMPPLPEELSLVAPYLGFLLQDGETNILVDSGISEKFIIDGKAWGALPAEGGSEFLIKSLANEGLKPEDIDTLIYTHLHNDHAANCQLFTQAVLIYQKDEWLNLLAPLPVQQIRRDYDPDVIQEISKMERLVVEGDLELVEGIRLLKTPGHTLGSQSVAVNTPKGVVVLVGDLCLVNFMTFPGAPEIIDMEGKAHPIPVAPPVFGPAIPHGIIYNAYDFYDSVQKVKAVASRNEPGFIIPGHEPSLVVTGI